MTFVRVCSVDDVEPNTAGAYYVNGHDVAIVSTEDGFFAIEDVCSHEQVPLSEGFVEKCTIECEKHSSRFDLATGKPLELPATKPVPVYPVRVVAGGDIEIDIDNPIAIQEP